MASVEIDVSGTTTATKRDDLKRTGIYIQNACLQHRYIRSKDTSSIVERPERLRAVTIGLSAAIARLGELYSSQKMVMEEGQSKGEPDADELVKELKKLKLDPDAPPISQLPITINQSNVTIEILNHPAVKFVHGDIEGDVYLENLEKWIKESVDRISKGESEIPEGYSQGDLYLCPGSINAIHGAVGTLCEAVDKVLTSTRSELSELAPLNRAFVSIRPPGHHCGEDTPSGFCFLNNVAIGAAHAHLQHGINRIVIFDIDLHHGNGTQSIVWQINEETYRQTLESEGGGDKPTKPGPRIYYGSIHDILSYPCEDGKPNFVQAASVSIHNSHGQYIENIHLQTYKSEQHFWDVLYKERYSKLLTRAREFLCETGSPGDRDDVLIFISCGMDACEHEYESMSRNNRKVPASFYYRFARDACALSDTFAKGRLISVLEGGYSDRALISGAMAHLSGLVDIPPETQVDEQWWSLENLMKLESATKKRRGGRASLETLEPWIQRTLEIFTPLDNLATTSVPRSTVLIPSSSRTLRDRTKGKSVTPSPEASPPAIRFNFSSSSSVPSRLNRQVSPQKDEQNKTTTSSTGGLYSADSSPLTSPSPSSSEDRSPPPIKKLPRVILKLGKMPDEYS